MDDKQLEEKVELITKHKVNNHLQMIWWSKQEAEFNKKLAAQSQEFLGKQLDEIKKLIKDLSKESKELYAPKSVVKDIERNSIDIRGIYKSINWLHIKIAAASGWWTVIVYFVSNL